MRPDDRKYRPSHEWVKVDGDIAYVGITDYAVSHLSDLVFLDLPDIGTDVMANEPFGEIESVKAVSDLYCPVTGEIVEQNDDLQADLGILGKDPWNKGWMVKIKMMTPSEVDGLMDAAAYEKVVEAEG
ncbi:MAG: glycine cleavage system protein GcvH [Planctomycetota bacterium]